MLKVHKGVDDMKALQLARGLDRATINLIVAGDTSGRQHTYIVVLTCSLFRHEYVSRL